MVIHIIIAVALVLVILVQSSKGSGLDGSLGGTATNILGGQAAPAFLKKATIGLAVLFMLSCFFLALHLSSNKAPKSRIVNKLKKEMVEKSVTEETTDELPVTLPAENTGSDSL